MGSLADFAARYGKVSKPVKPGYQAARKKKK